MQTDANGIYFHRARYYHPVLRRFLNQDVLLGSISAGAGLNRFAYANGAPVSGIDPLGLSSWNLMSALATAALNLGISGPVAAYGAAVAINEPKKDCPTGAPNSTATGYQPPGVLSSIGQGIAGAPAFWRDAIVNPNAPGSAIITAIEGAGEGIRNFVSLSAEGSVNIVPFVGGRFGGPGPAGFGPGGSANLSFAGLTLTPNVSAGKFGLSGAAGITFTAPGLSGQQIYNFTLAGGAGSGGAINISFDRNLSLTNISLTIGAGFGFEASGNLPIPVNGDGKR